MGSEVFLLPKEKEGNPKSTSKLRGTFKMKRLGFVPW
jgi:hypothetical protein